MSTKRKAPSSPPPQYNPKRSSKNNPFSSRRDGLGLYITSPQSYPSSVVLYHNASFVAITDLYPKSSVHYLLLPRSQAHTYQHPFDAFSDLEFLTSVRAEAQKVKTLAIKELQRKFGPFSKTDEQREAVLNGDVEATSLPAGRDWAKDIQIGVHAHPSMNHLHIHIISRDRYSEALKHRKHYNSFATGFFVDLEDFPLKGGMESERAKERYLERDLVCWRCEKNFGNRMKELKDHLEAEFEEWKRE